MLVMIYVQGISLKSKNLILIKDPNATLKQYW